MQNEQKELQPDLLDLYNQIKSDLTGYLSNKLRWAKLTIYEKLALTSSHVGFVFMVLLLTVCFFLLAVLVFGLFLGELLHSYAAGFGIMVLTVGILLALVLTFGKSVRRAIANLAVKIIQKVEQNEE